MALGGATGDENVSPEEAEDEMPWWGWLIIAVVVAIAVPIKLRILKRIMRREEGDSKEDKEE